jgi:hypothetical protein
MSGFSTSKGTKVFYNLTGHGKTEVEVVTAFADVRSFKGLSITREVITDIDLETDLEVSGAGKTVYGEFEIVFRVKADDATTYKQWIDAVRNSPEMTLKCHLPVGAGLDFLANVILTKVDSAIEAGAFLAITLSFKPTGEITVL